MEKRPKVLLVLPSAAPNMGGPSRSVASLYSQLKASGKVDAKFLAYEPDRKVDYHISIRTRYNIPDKASKEVLRSAIAETDVVHLNSIWNAVATLTMKYACQLKKPVILTPRGMLDPFCMKNKRWFKLAYATLFDNRYLKKLAALHFLTVEEKQGAAESFPFLAKIPSVITPNGAALPKLQDRATPLLPELFPQTKGKKTLLFLGRVDAIKGLDLPIRALLRIPEAERPMLLLVGPDYGQKPTLQQLTKDLNLGNYVLFHDGVFNDDRFHLLMEADLVGLTSIYDCNPVAATEAFAVGGAFIGTTGCGLTFPSQSGACVLVERSEEAFAAGVRKLLANDEARSSLRAKAKQFATTTLSWPQVIQPLEELYRELRGSSN